MEIKIFRSNKGDCLLLSNNYPNNKNRHILVDGGMAGSFRKHVTPTLDQIRKDGEVLDLVCVSHIDADHIKGILELLDQVMDWRVYNHFVDDEPHRKKPKYPEPPAIKEIWHNAFSEVTGDNTGAIVDALAYAAHVFSSSDLEEMKEAAEYATSVRQGIQLSRKINARQLGIPLNPRHGKKLIYSKIGDAPYKFGRMKLTIIGPTEDALEKLRKVWNKWLTRNEEALAKIREGAAEDEDLLHNGTPSFRNLIARSEELGNRKKVTAPNLASIMFLVEEGPSKILMTGDGHGKDIIEGLALNNKLDKYGRLHVDVLKVQHHGSEFNLKEEFCAKITADHYVFCGNGAHHNPDLRVLKAFVQSRIGDPNNPDIKSQNKEVDNEFTFWFNSNHRITTPANVQHMQDIEAYVTKIHQETNGQLKFKFLKDDEDFHTISL